MRRAANSTEESIGRSWTSAQGRHEVVGVADVGGSPRLVVRSDFTPLSELIRPEELDRRIVFDERNAASRSSRSQQVEDQALKDAQKKIAALGGVQTLAFLQTLPPLPRGKAEQALLRTRSWDGTLKTIAQGVADRVRAGAVVTGPPRSRRLELPSGVFVSEKAITKTGMDLAEFLANQSGRDDNPTGENTQEIRERIYGLLQGQSLAEQEAIVRHWIAQLDLQIELEEVRPTRGYEQRADAIQQVRRQFLSALDVIEAEKAKLAMQRRATPRAAPDQAARMRKRADELLRSHRRGGRKSLLGIFTRG